MEFQVLRCRFLYFRNIFSIFIPKIQKSKSNFKFRETDFSFFGNPNCSKIEISNFGRIDFYIFIPFRSKYYFVYRPYFLRSIYKIFARISLRTRKFCSPNFSSTPSRCHCPQPCASYVCSSQPAHRPNRPNQPRMIQI